MSVGRAVCVSLPFALAVLSLICLLAAGLSGIGSSIQSFYAFNADFTNLSISVPDFNSLTQGLNSGSISEILGGGANLTARKLGLADSYTVSVWSYCSTTAGNTNCSKPALNWAQGATNLTQLQDAATQNGIPVIIPSYASDLMTTFSTLVRWTQITFILAAVATILELVVGISALSSRLGSCCAFLNSIISALLTIIVASLITVWAGGSVGILKAANANFHTDGNVGNKSLLAVIWLSALFSLASAFFWLFSICCCKPTYRSKDSPSTVVMGDVHYHQTAPIGAYQRTQEPVFPAVHTGQPSGVPGARSSRNGPYEPFQR